MDILHRYSSFQYKIIRKKRKTIGIKITPEGEVIITSPFNVSEETILNIIKSKEKWIKTKLQLFIQNSSYKNRNFKTGEKISYMGRELEVRIINENQIELLMNSKLNNNIVKILNEKVIVCVNNKYNREDIIREYIIKFYKTEAERVLKERTLYYSKILSVSPKIITIKDQKTLWGSCSSRGNINYNYRLIMAPMNIIDYVVVHELSHLIHMNHSKEYWRTVEEVLPDYKERKQWLKAYGYMLSL